jgi:hypothetical protein
MQRAKLKSRPYQYLSDKTLVESNGNQNVIFEKRPQ